MSGEDAPDWTAGVSAEDVAFVEEREPAALAFWRRYKLRAFWYRQEHLRSEIVPIRDRLAPAGQFRAWCEAHHLDYRVVQNALYYGSHSRRDGD
jgi:hypothetical protein